MKAKRRSFVGMRIRRDGDDLSVHLVWFELGNQVDPSSKNLTGPAPSGQGVGWRILPERRTAPEATPRWSADVGLPGNRELWHPRPPRESLATAIGSDPPEREADPKQDELWLAMELPSTTSCLRHRLRLVGRWLRWGPVARRTRARCRRLVRFLTRWARRKRGVGRGVAETEVISVPTVSDRIWPDGAEPPEQVWMRVGDEYKRCW